jgi:hypothetical protein
METGYQIVMSKPEHLAALPRIERAAAEIFPEGMIPVLLHYNYKD